MGRELTPMAQALVLLKDLVQAKTRLAGLLSPSERRILAQAMLEDVLAVLAGHPQIDGITLLSDDPAAHLLAGQYDATHWAESELGCRGLNAVAASASARLLNLRAQPLLLVHADLPMLSAEDIAAVFTARREAGGLVVGCDRHGTGTNLLCFDAASAPTFCFGADSCGGHLAAARDRGIPATVLRRNGIGLDVDEPQDLVVLLEQLDGIAAGHTATLLRDAGLGARVRLALASLDSHELPLNEKEVG
jgi:2-phospho-L-lactate guanylyltransferase